METWLERTSFRPAPPTAVQSGLEQAFVDMIERSGLPTPVRQHPLVLPTGELIHLDLAWPDVRLAVEPGHSWWHGGDLRQRRDQDRDRACAVVGWHVVRYDETAAQDPAATARELLALYRRRRADLARFSGGFVPLSGSEERQKRSGEGGGDQLGEVGAAVGAEVDAVVVEAAAGAGRRGVGPVDEATLGYVAGRARSISLFGGTQPRSAFVVTTTTRGTVGQLGHHAVEVGARRCARWCRG